MTPSKDSKFLSFLHYLSPEFLNPKREELEVYHYTSTVSFLAKRLFPV